MTSRAYYAALLSTLVLVAGMPLYAAEDVTITRQGYFRELTDGESEGYLVNRVQMSADGTKVAFLTGAVPWGLDALRVINADGTGEAVIFANDQEPGYRIQEGFAISDDGSKVAYVVEYGTSGYESEIRLYDTTTDTSASLLTELPHTAWGETNNFPVEPWGGLAGFTMSGDGSVLFFINRWGPVGGNSLGLTPSGFTLYQVAVPSGPATVVFSQADIADLPGADPNTVSLLSASGVLATDYTGSVVLLPVGSDGETALRPQHLVRIPLGESPGMAAIVLDLVDTTFYGPSLSGDGQTMLFSRFGASAPAPVGLQIMNSDGSGTPVLLDPGLSAAGRYPFYPVLSRDATRTSHSLDLGGGSYPSIRTAPTDGSGPLPVSLKVVGVGGLGISSISADGNRIAMAGGIQTENAEPHPEVVVFDWYDGEVIPPGVPAVESISADPEVELVIQPGLQAETTTTYSYGVSGSGLAAMRSFSYDETARERDGIGTAGMGRIFDDLADDGLDGDAVAGDGVYDDVGIWAFGQEIDSETEFTGRGVITSLNGGASFSDFVIPLREPTVPVADFSVTPTAGVAPLEVTFTNTSQGDFVVEHWDLDGDGTFETWDPVPPITFTYDTPGEYTPGLKVTGYGNESQVHTVTVNVADPAAGGELCAVSGTLGGLFEQFKLEYGIADDDLDGGGVPEQFALALVELVGCHGGGDGVQAATVNAWVANAATLDAEAAFGDVEAYEDLLPVLLLLSQGTQAAVLDALANDGVVLTGEYVVVTCDGGTCSTGPGKAATEPYADDGDLDGDLVANANEYGNAVANGGGVEYFAAVAGDSTRDGLEPLEDRVDISRDGNVNAVDIQLVINGALGLDIGGHFADVDIADGVNAVDVQLVINAALGLL